MQCKIKPIKNASNLSGRMCCTQTRMWMWCYTNHKLYANKDFRLWQHEQLTNMSAKCRWHEAMILGVSQCSENEKWTILAHTKLVSAMVKHILSLFSMQWNEVKMRNKCNNERRVWKSTLSNPMTNFDIQVTTTNQFHLYSDAIHFISKELYVMLNLGKIGKDE